VTVLPMFGRRARGTRRRILVDSRTAMNYVMVAPVVRAMTDDPRVSFSFTASEQPDAIRAIYQDAPPGTRTITPRRAALSRWDAYLTSDFMWATLPRGTARVQMFHGVAGKYGFDAPTDSMRHWHRLFFVNERRLRNCIAAGALDRDSPAARLVGMPKVDCLVDGSLNRDDLLQQWELDPARPTVLYAPTWSPESSLNVMGISLIERLLSMPLNLIVKLHDRSRDRRAMYSGGVDWSERLRPLLAREHARLAAAADITPYLAAADVMLTDHSSAGFEFLLLDRPIVRIDLPDLIREARIHPDYVRLLAEVSTSVTSVDETIAAVSSALAGPNAGSATRRRVAADLFHRPGTATARAVASLYDVLDLEAPVRVHDAMSADASCELAAGR
jgi:hypothetical protein